MEKLFRYIVVFLLPLFFNFSCDGFVKFQGNILEGNSVSTIVTDSVYSSYNFQNPIKNAMVNFYAIDDNDSILHNMLSNTFFTDSLGYFSAGTGVGLGKYKGLLVVTKKGFISDSLFFEYENSQKPIDFIVYLRKGN